MSNNKKLTFEFYQKNDQILYSILTQDIRVMRYITEKAESETEVVDNFKKILHYNATHNDQTGYYKIFDQETYIGFGKLSWDDEDKIEIGYMILPEKWGKGYATLVIAHFLDWIKRSRSLSQFTVYAIIDPKNSASKHLLEKHAFVSVWQGIEDGLPSEHLIWQP
ncbi:GNAT family N-acetyltransferase [Enterococcus ureilyticus]|uniref:GNAT family N-acetyltransferase n=1 Tax=Enterococcus ureilyticus TaxID=1131292 RepID=A0A1E5HBH5_9ENTE|nr:GNAT family N-acetyltransferase [Enterococcus ureilyticus]MBM7688862.1 RimJ/RimL family protein N-acetyltransferase [Enterococcus ureilyticus]OEG21990.1 GNAT family N-acetyltransferase [Enterococcus ureilyticus]